MGDTMTQEETAKICQWAGVCNAGQLCSGYNSWKLAPEDATYFCGEEEEHGPHLIPMPALEGDFADVVEAKIRRKLIEDDCSVTYNHGGHVTISTDYTRGIIAHGADIFAAVLAYLEEK